MTRPVSACDDRAGRPGAARRGRGPGAARSRAGGGRSTRRRIEASNTATASPPASLAWYMAMSASRSMASAAGRVPRRRGGWPRRRWPRWGSRSSRTRNRWARLRRVRSASSRAWSGARRPGPPPRTRRRRSGPRDRRPGCWPRAAAHGVEQLVAHAVAEAVVDQPEAVEVEEHQGDRARRSSRPSSWSRWWWAKVRLASPVSRSWVAWWASRATRPGSAGAAPGTSARPAVAVQAMTITARMSRSPRPCSGPAQRDQRRDAQRHGHEHEAGRARSSPRCRRDRARPPAQRRVQEGGHERHVGQPEGQVEEAGVDVGDVGVHQHVDQVSPARVASERDEEQAQRHRPIALAR